MDKAACQNCSPADFNVAEGVDSIDTTIGVDELDKMEQDNVDEDMVVLPQSSSEQELERKMWEQMIEHERKRSFERRTSSGGANKEDIAKQKKA